MPAAYRQGGERDDGRCEMQCLELLLLESQQ